MTAPCPTIHTHAFIDPEQARNEQRTWAVIALCAATMVAEIVGGWLFGSVALVADGAHMSTHAGALLLAALAYRFARRHAADPRFSFGTGKIGDLAGYTSAIILGLISLLIAGEAVAKLFSPNPIHFAEAIPIACLGLSVNIASAFLLGAHHHDHDHGHDDHDHDHAGHARDNNMRAAIVHVVADAAVSVLVIAGLILAWAFGWNFMDPMAGLVGAGVIASWSYALIRDTGAILLDMSPDETTARSIRAAVEAEGDRLADLHVWRLAPGHLGAIVSVASSRARAAGFYHDRLGRVPGLSHLTVEVEPA